MLKTSLSVLASLVFATSAFAQTAPAPAPVTAVPAMDMHGKMDMAAKPSMPAAASATSATSAPAAGGGPGKVWVNTSSKVYHCQNDKYYGKTKHGEYLNEADAKTKGFHGVGGKACG
jgi:hypothetical protein